MERIDPILAAATPEEIAAAEKRMFAMIADKTIMPNYRKRLTLDDVYTREERLLIAYAPVVMAENIWQYIDKVLIFCAANRISEVKKLGRAVKEVRKAYYDFLRQSIDRAHLDSAAEAGKQFREDFAYDMTIMWFTIRGELLKLYPDMQYTDMRTDALSAILLVKVLKKFCRDVDRDIEKRMHVEASTLNPILRDLDEIMDGYVGNYEIDRTELVRRCEVILYNAMKTIKYTENGKGPEDV